MKVLTYRAAARVTGEPVHAVTSAVRAGVLKQTPVMGKTGFLPDHVAVWAFNLRHEKRLLVSYQKTMDAWAKVDLEKEGWPSQVQDFVFEMIHMPDHVKFPYVEFHIRDIGLQGELERDLGKEKSQRIYARFLYSLYNFIGRQRAGYILEHKDGEVLGWDFRQFLEKLIEKKRERDAVRPEGDLIASSYEGDVLALKPWRGEASSEYEGVDSLPRR